MLNIQTLKIVLLKYDDYLSQNDRLCLNDDARLHYLKTYHHS